MSNNSNYEKFNSSVLFFRSGKSYYYNFNGYTHEVNAITINKLKEKLILPFNVLFSGLSRAQIGRIIGSLLDNTTNVEIKKINDKKNNILRFEAIFTRQRKFIETYKIPNINSLYGRTKNCNPFLYTNINSNKVLIEVPKDYAKDNIEDCYFLSCDLDSAEKQFFDSQYTELEYDYIYKLEKNFNTKKIIQKSLRKK